MEQNHHENPYGACPHSHSQVFAGCTTTRTYDLSESSDVAAVDQKKVRIDLTDGRSISGFRNILVHDYLGGIDIELIWQVIEKELGCEVNVPEGDLVQYTSAMGAALLGHLRLKQLSTVDSGAA